MSIEKQLRDAALSVNPRFFCVRRFRVVSTQELFMKVPYDITFVQFGEDYLADPATDPIGVYGDGAGNRKYLWRDQWYSEYPLHLGPLTQRHDEIGGIVREMRAPLEGLLTTPGAVPQSFVWRALYRRDD